MACGECDTLQRFVMPQVGERLQCIRCGARLYKHHAGGIESTLALLYSAIILYATANLLPFISMDIQGHIRVIYFWQVTGYLFNIEMRLLALIVGFTIVIAPIGLLISAAYVLTAIRYRFNWPGLKTLLALLSHMSIWTMLDVFMLSVLVGMIKLVEISRLTPESGLYVYAGLILVFTAALSRFEPKDYWDQLDGGS